MNIYLVGFHPMKEEPSHQMEAHHFCTQINEDFAQCALFDGNTEDAKLTGIEYIISERIFDTLPEEEKKYWHPHNYEILSGQLVAPGLPAVADKELMESKMNSYGKTWHVWSTGNADGDGDKIPLGDPKLAWSFNRDGEAKPGLVEKRDNEMDIDSREKRQERKDLIPLAKPQEGVDALKGEFPRETQEIPGVQSKKDSNL
ncbi:OBAP family protein [Zunongwangia sp. SCSIO 43204]|uniref:OBAP family protein n=1 Tax=Zunongwangia sp. SCSIO 43204 TaxID=2779359 RepID=UPI001CA7FED5|nr:OBAP family protein [Zunongwangia sp. SCSIO 43204]UAB84404.1 OBAP family protein [Zunongwangia sp. SCSIO 43204]